MYKNEYTTKTHRLAYRGYGLAFKHKAAARHRRRLSAGLFYRGWDPAASFASDGWYTGHRCAVGTAFCRAGRTAGHLLLLLAAGDPMETL